MNLSYEQARTLRRRHRHERQAVVYGALVAGMAVAALGATAVYTGVVDAPFSRELTTLAPDTPDVLAAPCPPEGTLPTYYSNANVRVLNGTGRAGLAGQTAGDLAARGFTVIDTGNNPSRSVAVAEVRFGQLGLPAAYTVAAQVEGAYLLIDTREDDSVDLVLGEAFDALREPGEVPLAPGEPVTGPEGCVPLDEALLAAEPPAPLGGSDEGEEAQVEDPEGGEDASETAEAEA